MRFSALAAQLQGFAHSTILACRAESASVAHSTDNLEVGMSLLKVCLEKLLLGNLIPPLYES